MVIWWPSMTLDFWPINTQKLRFDLKHPFFTEKHPKIGFTLKRLLGDLIRIWWPSMTVGFLTEKHPKMTAQMTVCSISDYFSLASGPRTLYHFISGKLFQNFFILEFKSKTSWVNQKQKMKIARAWKIFYFWEI